MAMLERVLLGIGVIIDILYQNWSISIFNASLNYATAAAQGTTRGTTHDSPFYLLPVPFAFSFYKLLSSPF